MQAARHRHAAHRECTFSTHGSDAPLLRGPCVATARPLAQIVDEADVGQGAQSWIVLADPEGNEFCVLGSRLL
jgi:hypothetical protein